MLIAEIIRPAEINGNTAEAIERAASERTAWLAAKVLQRAFDRSIIYRIAYCGSFVEVRSFFHPYPLARLSNNS